MPCTPPGFCVPAAHPGLDQAPLGRGSHQAGPAFGFGICTGPVSRVSWLQARSPLGFWELAAGGIGGTAVDIAIQAQNMAHVKRTMQTLTAEHTGQSVETIERDADRDRWFTAAEALEYGFVDKVVEQLDDVRPDSPRKVGL